MVGIPYMCYGPTNINWNSNETTVKYWSVYIKGCEVACLSSTSFSCFNHNFNYLRIKFLENTCGARYFISRLK